MKSYILYFNNNKRNDLIFNCSTINELSRKSHISKSSLYRIMLNPTKYLYSDYRKKKYKGYRIEIIKHTHFDNIIKKPKKDKKKIVGENNINEPIIKIEHSNKIILSFD